jgi:hypothetical protein
VPYCLQVITFHVRVRLHPQYCGTQRES